MTETIKKGRPPGNPDSKKVKLTISFNPLLLASLNEYAAKCKRPKTEIIEEAVKEYLKKKK